jgi:hypothetical protein
MRRTLSVLAVLALSAPARAEGPGPSKSDSPVQLRLLSKQESYRLAGGKQLKKQIEQAEKAGGRFPAPPAVDLVVEITNRGDKDVQVWVSGDPVTLGLQLAGPGAKSVKAQRFFTREFRAPRAVTIPAGKTHSIPIRALKFGFRGIADHAYWSEPGEYTLTANFATAVKPAPKGSTAAEGGFGRVTLKSEPIRIKVEEAK